VKVEKSIDGLKPYAPIGLATVLLATCLVYLPAMGGGRLVDDDISITKPSLQSLSGLYYIWFSPTATLQYYPLVHTAFWLEHKLWGDALVGYHLVTLLWHGIAVTLVYVILQKLKYRARCWRLPSSPCTQ
jgi:hypothetical protein